LLPQISAPILKQTAALLTDVFEDSRDDSEEDHIRAPRRSGRLRKTPRPIGTRSSARKKGKATLKESSDSGSGSDEDNEYKSEEESEASGESEEEDESEVEREAPHGGGGGRKSANTPPSAKTVQFLYTLS
jgi:hypothetical protein